MISIQAKYDVYMSIIIDMINHWRILMKRQRVIKKTLLRELKKFQMMRQLNVSDSLIEQIANHLASNLDNDMRILSEDSENSTEIN